MMTARAMTLFAAVFFLATIAIAIPIVRKELASLPPPPRETIAEDTPPQLTPVIVIANWKVFSNLQFGYSIQYPPEADYTVNPVTAVYRHFVTFTRIRNNDDDGSTERTELFSLTIRPTTLSEETTFQRFRIDGHMAATFLGQTEQDHQGLTASRLMYRLDDPEDESKLMVVSIAKSPYVYTLYFPRVIDPSLVDRVVSTLTILH